MLTVEDILLVKGPDVMVATSTTKVLEAANQMANAAALATQNVVQVSLAAAGAFSDFVRQAVAAVDERTTPCCLGVHGQVRDLDEWYETPDAPAYAERQKRPPFHDYCRTSQVLVIRTVAEDDLTRRMRRAATLEMVLRGRPDYRAPHPADAFTRTTA